MIPGDENLGLIRLLPPVSPFGFRFAESIRGKPARICLDLAQVNLRV